MDDITPAREEDNIEVIEESQNALPTNRDVCPFSTNKDLDKTAIDTEYKSADYDKMNIAESDCSLDNITIYQERLAQKRKVRRKKILEEQIIAKETKETLQQVHILGSRNEANLHLMNVLSQDSHDGMNHELLRKLYI